MDSQNLGNNQDTVAPTNGQAPIQANASNPPTDGTSTEDILNKDILELMGAKNMPEEKKQELYQKMMETIQNRMIGKAFDLLEEKDKAEFKRLAEEQKKSELEEFLKARGINLSKMMLQESLLYKTEMAELSKTIQQATQK